MTNLGERAATWFLFTDLEDSTRLWDHEPAAMEAALARHDALLAEQLVGHGGRVVKHTGDGVLAVFDTARAALDAAVAIQHSFQDEDWPTGEPLRTRIGVHGGPPDSPDDSWYHRHDDYVGPCLHRTARLMSAAHGGQVVCSRAVALCTRDDLPPTLELVDLGSHVLRGLVRPERVYQLRTGGLVASFPPLRTGSETAGNLPQLDDELIGREREIDAVGALVRRHRLVTLVGVGGVGKTRLSLAVAEELANEFPDGVWFVPLAHLVDPDLVASAVATVLGIRERAGIPVHEAVAEAIAEREVLVVLDNCEHVIDAAARLAEAIVGHGGAHLLATSRERLDVGGEHGFPVPMLDLPTVGASREEAMATAAVRLFVDRAGAVEPSFELGDSDVPGVVDLCRKLDGIPLALELAASRCDSFSPTEIAGHLERRRDLLGRRPRASSRHGTLQEAIDWSYELLEPDEQMFFRRLAVFSGFDADAAETVAARAPLDPLETPDLLGRLVRKSMVVVERTDRWSRYRLLDTLRYYAAQKLAETDEEETLRAAHTDYYTQVVEKLADDVRGPGQSLAYEQLQRELDNIRATFDSLIERDDATRALLFVRILRTFWSELLPIEGVNRALTALALADDLPADKRAGGYADVSWMGYLNGREEAGAHARESLRISREGGYPPDPEALMTLGALAIFVDHDPATAVAHFDAATAVARDVDDGYEIASGLTGACLSRAMIGDTEFAIEQGAEAVTIARELGYDTQIAGALAVHGFALGLVDPVRALELLEESLSVKDDTSYAAVAHVVAGHLAVLLGDVDASIGYFVTSLRISREVDESFFVPTALEGLGAAICLSGRADAGARLLGVADTARKKLELPGVDVEIQLRTVAEGLVAAALGDRFATVRDAGRELTLEDGLAEAFAATPGDESPLSPAG